jgi:translation elongation factor EF-Tu-like GTPase
VAVDVVKKTLSRQVPETAKRLLLSRNNCSLRLLFLINREAWSKLDETNLVAIVRHKLAGNFLIVDIEQDSLPVLAASEYKAVLEHIHRNDASIVMQLMS